MSDIDKLREFVRLAGSATAVEKLALDLADENAALKRENERLKTYASTLLELALDDVELPLLTAEEQE